MATPTMCTLPNSGNRFRRPEIVEMTKYLGELTAREFARDHLVTVTGLRLGELVLEDAVQERNTKPCVAGYPGCRGVRSAVF